MPSLDDMVDLTDDDDGHMVDKNESDRKSEETEENCMVAALEAAKQ